MCDGVYQLVFLSPEALLSNKTWRDTVPSPVYQENLVAVIIDEFYQPLCHVTLGSNITNYIPLWNENLAHVTRRIFFTHYDCDTYCCCCQTKYISP